MRTVTLLIVLVFFFLLAIVSFTFAAGFGGRATSASPIQCHSGQAFNVGSRYAFPFWFPGRTPSSGKMVLGLYRTTDDRSCCIPAGEDCVPVTVYRVDKFGQ